MFGFISKKINLMCLWLITLVRVESFFWTTPLWCAKGSQIKSWYKGNKAKSEDELLQSNKVITKKCPYILMSIATTHGKCRRSLSI